MVGCVEARFEVGELEWWWWMFSMVKSSCSLLPSSRNSNGGIVVHISYLIKLSYVLS